MMPFIETEESEFSGISLNREIAQNNLEVEQAYATSSDRHLAAFRLENTFGSWLSQVDNLPDGSKASEYDLWENLTEDERLDEQFIDNARYAENMMELNAVRKQRERENKDRQTLANGGFFETLAASMADPVNFIPVGGSMYRTYKTGGSILQGARATSMAAVGSTALTEAANHHTQLTRTYGETGVNLTAAAFLGGVFGATPGTISKMFSKKDLADVEKVMDPEAAVRDGKNSTYGDGSVGAAEVNADAKVRGKFARKAIEILGFDPLSRTITSNAKATRSAVNDLAENPLDMDVPIRTSVESKIKIHDGKYFESIEIHEKAFKGYKAAGGELDRRGFNELVSSAKRNGSKDEFVQRSADGWENKLYKPLADDAVGVKLLPEDVDVATATHYLNRMWNKEKVGANLDKFVKIVTRWLDEQNAGKAREDIETESLALEIAGRVMGTTDGRLPYDYKIGDTPSGGASSSLKGPLKKRSFLIPDELVEEFLENDIEKLGARYLKAMAPDIELVKRFGDIDMKDAIKNIEQEYLGLMNKAKDEKARLKLGKAKDADIRDIAAMRDRIRGVYGQVDHNNPWVRAGRVMRDLNYMRLLGGVVASSVPDVARIVMAEGIANTFSKGLLPLMTNLKTFKVAAREAKLYGVGTDALMGGRAEIIADVADYAAGNTAVERGVRSMATKFSSINLMNQWTSGVKQLHAVVMQTRVAKELLKGKYDKRLGQLGISEADAQGIAKQLKKHGKEMDGVYVFNTKQWDNQALADMWGGAIRKESDRVIIMPGQEKPLFMSTELGKTIFQFKTFMFSSTQRVLFSTLQNQDKHTIQGLIGLTSLGMMAYAFKNWDAGRPLSDDPKVWVMEGIDRSGMLGWLMEANNTMEKITMNGYGLRPMIGIDAPASRYASRSVLDSAVGPSFGLIGEVLRVAGAATGQREWSDSDTRAFRRLLPGQNLSFFRQALDKLEDQIK